MAKQKVQRFENLAASWTADNPILPAGWEGIESDTGKWKAGDGLTRWNDLAYVSSGAAIGVAVTGATQGSVLFAGNAGILAQNNTAFFWDDTNHRLILNGGSGEIPFQIANSTVSYGLFMLGVDNAGEAFVQASPGVIGFSFKNINGLITPHRMDLSAVGGAIANLFKGYNPTDIPARIQLAAAQTADAFQVYASDGVTKLFYVDSVGSVTSANNITCAGTTGSTSSQVYFSTSLTSYATGSKITCPSDGLMKFASNSGNIFSLVGGGTAVASAAALPLPTGRVFHVTGTTNITSITSTNFQSGAVITLIFDGVLTLTNGGNIKIGSNYVTAAGSAITLAYDGTNWYQVGRL